MAKDKIEQLKKELALSQAPKYKALKRGFDGLKVREIGEEFNFLGKPGSWMKPVNAKAEAAEVAMVDELLEDALEHKAEKPEAKGKGKDKPAKDESKDVL